MHEERKTGPLHAGVQAAGDLARVREWEPDFLNSLDFPILPRPRYSARLNSSTGIKVSVSDVTGHLCRVERDLPTLWPVARY